MEKSHASESRDFTEKFFTFIKRVEARSSGSGFLYLPVARNTNLSKTLTTAKIYIPNLHRADNGKSLLFFEIDLKPAIDAAAGK